MTDITHKARAPTRQCSGFYRDRITSVGWLPSRLMRSGGPRRRVSFRPPWRLEHGSKIENRHAPDHPGLYRTFTVGRIDSTRRAPGKGIGPPTALRRNDERTDALGDFLHRYNSGDSGCVFTVELGRPLSALETYIAELLAKEAAAFAPRIGRLRLQAVRPATITKLYRDLLNGGGKNGKPLSPTTVAHVHTVLRKALRDAVVIDEVLPNNPAERAKLPRNQRAAPGTIWTPA
ncbi:hypothetical protein Sru01_47090 [Sphaerisporangium rufum]|uniref:Core-binding (CB) domain-containing protein n=1 Tax=Sphaerisporangium rufum TaxID=1381558 RepID=A0A919R4V0_9ACTN|nr:hypothetical protein [Sphaerisporangium rufum]GII79727.1 hypothetical protein Sru01_47090 [Sphaerisporangium rufum]